MKSLFAGHMVEKHTLKDLENLVLSILIFAEDYLKVLTHSNDVREYIQAIYWNICQKKN